MVGIILLPHEHGKNEHHRKQVIDVGIYGSIGNIYLRGNAQDNIAYQQQPTDQGQNRKGSF